MRSTNSFLATLRLTAVAFTSTAFLSLLPAGAYGQTGLPALRNPFWSYTVSLNDPGQPGPTFSDDGDDISVSKFFNVEYERSGEIRTQLGSVKVSQQPNDELLLLSPLFLPSIGPYVYAFASAPFGPGNFFDPEVQSRVFIRFDFRTRSVAEDIVPPFQPVDIPLAVFFQLQTAVDIQDGIVGPGLYDVSAVARLEIRDGAFDPILVKQLGQNVETSDQEGVRSMVNLSVFTAKSDTEHRVFLEAITTLRLRAGSLPAEAHAFADPLIMFDQETFDATWGEDSFPLADYFRIEYSPGIVFVPEPSTLLIAAVGIVCLLSQRRRSIKLIGV